MQVHLGVDQDRALVVPTSPNYTTSLDVTCFWAPAADFSKTKFREGEMGVRDALIARSPDVHPLVWIEADTPAREITSFSGATVTSTSHGLSSSDVVLIRRLGADLYTLGAIGSVTTHTFALAPAHAYANGDDIFKVEAVWYGMAFDQMSPVTPSGQGDSFAEEVVYRFVGSGSLTYRRQTIDLDSL
jgi:hypothetical protein